MVYIKMIEGQNTSIFCADLLNFTNAIAVNRCLEFADSYIFIIQEQTAYFKNGQLDTSEQAI